MAEAEGADSLTAYVNMDMVGRLEDEVIAGAVGSSPVWRREIERRNAVIGLPIRVSEDPYRPTDATAFCLSGVPILSLFSGAHADYHRPSDTADTLNCECLADIARFLALVARSRVMAEDEPAYVARARPTGEGGRRMGNIFLGTIPDYATEGVTGVPLSGVVKDGPAEEAGVEGGDVVVGLAGQELETIYDYVRVMNGLKPGGDVSMTVRRDGEPTELSITPRVRKWRGKHCSRPAPRGPGGALVRHAPGRARRCARRRRGRGPGLRRAPLRHDSAAPAGRRSGPHPPAP